MTEATGKVSERIFRKLGFIDRFISPYKEFSYGGNRVFQGINDHDAAILLEKHLDSLIQESLRKACAPQHLLHPTPPALLQASAVEKSNIN